MSAIGGQGTISRVLTGLENPFHILIVAVVVLLLFGPKRLPENSER